MRDGFLTAPSWHPSARLRFLKMFGLLVWPIDFLEHYPAGLRPSRAAIPPGPCLSMHSTRLQIYLHRSRGADRIINLTTAVELEQVWKLLADSLKRANEISGQLDKAKELERISKSQATKLCDACSKPFPKLKICSGCHSRLFCSQECQKVRHVYS